MHAVGCVVVGGRSCMIQGCAEVIDLLQEHGGVTHNTTTHCGAYPSCGWGRGRGRRNAS